MKIVLIGFACCYKSSVGKLLSEKLNYDYIDTDALIEKSFGKTITEIFAQEGEKSFRVKESEVLRSLVNIDNTVISCGGGSPLSTDFNELANVSKVVWLTAMSQTVCSRLGTVPRPLFDGKPQKEISDLLKTREPYYLKYADITLATDNLSSRQVADILYGKLVYVNKNEKPL